jgi:hypothetical protein
MKIKQVDMINFEPLQTFITGLANMLSAIGDLYSAIRAAHHAALGGQKKLIPAPLNALADEALILTVLVNGRCIQVGNTKLNRAINRRARFLIIAFTVPADHAHTAQTDGWQRFPGVTQISLLQDSDSVRLQ